MTYARISDLPGRSRSDSPQVCTLEITFETDRAQKYSLSSEIQPLQVEEVAQNGVLDRRISADFRRISALKEGQALADCLDIVVGCRTHHVLNGCAIYDSLERSDSSISAKSSKTRDHPPLDLVLRSPHSFLILAISDWCVGLFDRRVI